MPKIASGLLAITCLLLLTVAVIQRRAPKRALYHGKDAMFWSEALGGNFQQRTNAEHALKVMGPVAAHDLANVLPLKTRTKDRVLLWMTRIFPTKIRWKLLKWSGVFDPQTYPAIAARGLEKLGTAAREVVFNMEAAIPVSNPDVYWPLMGALEQINPEGLLALARVLRQGEQTRAIAAASHLRLLGTNALVVLPDLLWVLTNQQPAAATAAIAIGAIGVSALPSITPLLNDKDSHLVSLGILALNAMGRSAEPVLPLLFVRAAINNHTNREQVIRAIGNINPYRADSLAVLKSAAGDDDPIIRRAAVVGLANVPLRVWHDRPLFDALVSDPDPQVRQIARSSLGATNPLPVSSGASRRIAK